MMYSQIDSVGNNSISGTQTDSIRRYIYRINDDAIIELKILEILSSFFA